MSSEPPNKLLGAAAKMPSHWPQSRRQTIEEEYWMDTNNITSNSMGRVPVISQGSERHLAVAGGGRRSSLVQIPTGGGRRSSLVQVPVAKAATGGRRSSSRAKADRAFQQSISGMMLRVLEDDNRDQIKRRDSAGLGSLASSSGSSSCSSSTVSHSIIPATSSSPSSRRRRGLIVTAIMLVVSVVVLVTTVRGQYWMSHVIEEAKSAFGDIEIRRSLKKQLR